MFCADPDKYNPGKYLARMGYRNRLISSNVSSSMNIPIGPFNKILVNAVETSVAGQPTKFDVRWGRMHPEYAVDINNLASLLEDRGTYEEAETLFRQALAIRQKAFGAEHPAVARGMNNLGRVLLNRNKLAEALPFVEPSLAMRKGLALREKKLPADHWQVAPAAQGTD